MKAKAAVKKKVNLKKYLPIYLMLAPGFIYLLINNYIPMAGIIIAFKKLNFQVGILKSPWAGLSNFEYLFKTPDAWRITRNTLLYNIAFIIFGTIFAIAVAIMLSQLRSKMSLKIYQTLILLPYLLSMVIVSYLAYAFLAGDTGFINGVRKFFGQDAIMFYSEPKYWPFILIFVNLWKNVGYNSIIYLSTILGIDSELYEAARIDGAGNWQQVKYITIPLLKTTIITLTLMAIGRIFYSDFGLFYQVPMNSGALVDITNTIDTYVYRALITLGDISMSSAAGAYQSLVGFVLVMIANSITRKISKENALF